MEDVNRLVMNGMSFRDAYKQVGADLMADNYTPLKTIKHTHEGSIGNLCLDEIREKMNLMI